MRTFVISLLSAVERREKIKKQLDDLGIPFEFVDAVKGVDFYDNPEYFNRTASMKYEKRLMNPGEIGCALSHQKIYRKMIEEDLPYVLIFEDDAVLSPDIVKVLPELEKNIKPNQLITMAKCDLTLKKQDIPLTEIYNLSKPYMVKYGSMAQTPGYLITKEAAAKILEINFPVYIPADSWGRYRKIIDFRGVTPTQTLVHQDMSLDSSIVAGIRNTAGRSTVKSLLFYNFYTQWAVGRFMKKIYQLTLKKWKTR